MSVFIPARVVRVKLDSSEFIVISSDNHLEVLKWLERHRDDARRNLKGQLRQISEGDKLLDSVEFDILEEKRDRINDYDETIRLAKKAIADIHIGKPASTTIATPLGFRVQIGDHVGRGDL